MFCREAEKKKKRQRRKKSLPSFQRRESFFPRCGGLGWRPFPPGLAFRGALSAPSPGRDEQRGLSRAPSREQCVGGDQPASTTGPGPSRAPPLPSPGQRERVRGARGPPGRAARCWLRAVTCWFPLSKYGFDAVPARAVSWWIDKN